MDKKNKKKFQSILLAKNLMPSRAFSAVEDREVFEFLNEVELAVILKAASGTIKAHFPFNDVFTEVELNKAEGFSIAIIDNEETRITNFAYINGQSIELTEEQIAYLREESVFKS